MEWALLPLKRYVEFEGRSRRKEYWLFFLLCFGVHIAAGLLDMVTHMPIIGVVAILALFLPSLSVGVRRLHDTGRSGWWLLIGLIPLVGVIVLLVFAVQKGEAGPNKFGADPLADEAPAPGV